jgi:hypothetical protein
LYFAPGTSTIGGRSGHGGPGPGIVGPRIVGPGIVGPRIVHGGRFANMQPASRVFR